MNTRLATVLLLFLTLVAACPAAEPELTGAWKGHFQYPARAGKKPVPFTVVLLNDGREVRGVIVEINTIGQQGAEPWLHAWVHGGRYDRAARQVTISKRYVGTDDVSHLVQYQGQLSADGSTISGNWQIPGNWGSTFQLTRLPQTGPGAMAGVWTGMYRYSDAQRDEQNRVRPPVVFSMFVVQRGRGWWGYSEEPRTFGDGAAPRLFAIVEGRETDRPGEFKFTKTYDGTGGNNHSVEYRGRLIDGSKMSGDWELAGGDGGGTFVAIGGGLTRDGAPAGLPELDELPEIPRLPSLDELSRGPDAANRSVDKPQEPSPSPVTPAPPRRRRR